MNPQQSTPSELEQLLEQKIQEYSKAEAEGRSHSELAPLYNELKQIRYQLTVNKSGLIRQQGPDCR
ncbi:MAG TPA: hypothetical protein VF145_04420 [Chitinophagaceae bacterium]